LKDPAQPQAPIAPPNTVVTQQPDMGGGSENLVQGPAVNPGSPGAPQPIDLGPAIQNLWASLPSGLTKLLSKPLAALDALAGDTFQINLDGGVTAYAEAMRASDYVPLVAQAVPGPLAPGLTGTAGPKQETVVVNLAPAAPTGFGALPEPTTQTPVVLAPWTATGAQAFDAALAQWGAEHLDLTPGRGLTLWPTRPRPQLVL
jgi:hypothetical protein